MKDKIKQIVLEEFSSLISNIESDFKKEANLHKGLSVLEKFPREKFIYTDVG